VFDDDNPLALLRQIKPDVHAKGGSWKPERIGAEKKLVESWGGKLRLFPMIGDHSTTKLIENIQSKS
jgi:bifunctional ADP-heptose synthase (sugar kinase/adenylyltransferase)